MKKKLLRLTAVSVMALSVSTGVAAAHSGVIDGTGRDSANKVTFADQTERGVRNNANLDVEHNNKQNGSSGDAKVHNNETGGDAATGNVTQESLANVTGEINNSGSSAAALASNGGSDHTANVSNTGRDSYNSVSVHSKDSTKVSNNTNVGVTNNTTQNATSGSAKATNNSEGGSAKSGAVKNTSTTSVNLTVTN